MQSINNNFALIGASGYVAVKHFEAIKKNTCDLKAICDPNDSIGAIDAFFPKAKYFGEFERFESYIESSIKNEKIDWLSVCSPNYLHSSHILMGLRQGCNIICEKPLALTLLELDHLEEMENASSGNIFTILQLRHHSKIIELKKRLDLNKKYDIDLTYITSRGDWYNQSWKGDVAKSGGLATNIGIHFFDMLCWIFGDHENTDVHVSENDVVSGVTYLKFAKVSWFLSTNGNYIVNNDTSEKKKAYRNISVDGVDIEFSGGFTDLHTESYKNILSGEGFRIADTREAIKIVEMIRSKPVVECKDMHRFLKK